MLGGMYLGPWNVKVPCRVSGKCNLEELEVLQIRMAGSGLVKC